MNTPNAESVAVPRPATMRHLMDDVPEGKANEAVNLGHPAGDCLRACVASVLDLDPNEVPHFVQYIEHPAGSEMLWWWALVGFCAWHGWKARYQLGGDPPSGWSLADGLSPRGHAHVCVAYDGEVMHDPHPSRGGLTRIDGWITLSQSDGCVS